MSEDSFESHMPLAFQNLLNEASADCRRCSNGFATGWTHSNHRHQGCFVGGRGPMDIFSDPLTPFHQICLALHSQNH